MPSRRARFRSSRVSRRSGSRQHHSAKYAVPLGPVTALTFRSSRTDWLDGLPGEPASELAVPVPTMALLHFAGNEAWPSISDLLQNGKYFALFLTAFE